MAEPGEGDPREDPALTGAPGSGEDDAELWENLPRRTPTARLTADVQNAWGPSAGTASGSSPRAASSGRPRPAPAAAAASTSASDPIENRVLRWVDPTQTSDQPAARAAGPAVVERPTEAPTSRADASGRPTRDSLMSAIRQAPSAAPPTHLWGPRILAAASLLLGLIALIAALPFGASIGPQLAGKLAPKLSFAPSQELMLEPGRYAILAYSIDEVALTCTLDPDSAELESVDYRVTQGRTQYRALALLDVEESATATVTCASEPMTLRIMRISPLYGIAAQLALLGLGVALLLAGAWILGGWQRLRERLTLQA